MRYSIIIVLSALSSIPAFAGDDATHYRKLILDIERQNQAIKLNNTLKETTRNDIERINRKRREMNNKLEHMRDKRKATQEEIGSIQTKIDQNKKRTKDLQESIGELDNRLKTTERGEPFKRALRRNRDVKLADISEKENELQQLQEKLQVLTPNLMNTEVQFNTLTKETEHLNQEKMIFEKQMKNYEQDGEKLSKTVKTLESERSHIAFKNPRAAIAAQTPQAIPAKTSRLEKFKGWWHKLFTQRPELSLQTQTTVAPHNKTMSTAPATKPSWFSTKMATFKNWLGKRNATETPLLFH